MDGILRWSSVSRHHFKEKVTVILEILIRKYGTATVKGLAPDKYKDFVADVVLNRHGKTSSKETGSGDAKQEVPDSSSKGNNKRKQDEREISGPGERTARPWKSNMGKRRNVAKPSESARRSDRGGIKCKREDSSDRGFKSHSGGNRNYLAFEDRRV